MALPPPPGQARQGRGFKSGLVLGIVAGLIIAAVGFGVILILGGRDTTSAAPSRSSTPSSTPSSIPSVKPKEPPGEVTQPFQDQEWVKGDRLLFFVADFNKADADCTMHTFTDTKTLMAYESDCQSWENSGTDILIFYVALRNPTGRAITYNLRNFVLTARDTRTFGPVNVRSDATYPPNFLPETGKLPPKSNLVGYLTFDGRVTGMVPARLSYVGDPQTLTVIFKGKPGTGS